MNEDLLNDSNIDKAEEYFKTKDLLKSMKKELNEIKSSMDEYIELQKIMKRVKELREKIKADETIHEMQGKIKALAERKDLLKEIIRVELLETGKEEVVKDDRKLKLSYILKESKYRKSSGDYKNKMTTRIPNELVAGETIVLPNGEIIREKKPRYPSLSTKTNIRS